jgi:hypothetical protein
MIQSPKAAIQADPLLVTRQIYITFLNLSHPNYLSLPNTGALIKPFTVSKQVVHQALPVDYLCLSMITTIT